MPSVNVTINGKNYRMACDDGQEAHLESLAAEFDRYVNTLKGSFGDIGDQRLTVMAGVMVTDELLELKEKLSKTEAELAKVKDSSLLQNREKQAGDEELSQAIIEAASKIENLSKKMAKSSG